MTRKAVVLAAGRGDRLERLTDECAKCLVLVAGRPMIHYVLTSLARAGVGEAVLVVGYCGEQVERELGDGGKFGLKLHYAWNREYALGNASSLWRALPLVAGEPFLLVMADHLCSASLLKTFLDQLDGRSAIAVDRSDLGQERIEEATKVALNDSLVMDLGKGLARWDAVDTGFSHWAAGAFGPASDAPAEGELAALMTRIARTEGGLTAGDVGGHFWLDVDTEQDLRLAERLLASDERLLD